MKNTGHTAAPDLLEAAREALATLDGSGHAAVATLRAAIAKAVPC